MKKLKLIIIGNDEYEDVSNGGRYPKWDFKVNPICECILMDRKTLPGQKGPYDLYTIIHKIEKTKHVIFAPKVLEDKLKNLPLHSCVKIEFLGKHPSKNYFQFKIGWNKSFQFDPAVYTLDEYVDAGGTSDSPVQGAGTTSKLQVQEFNDDLPF